MYVLVVVIMFLILVVLFVFSVVFCVLEIKASYFFPQSLCCAHSFFQPQNNASNAVR